MIWKTRALCGVGAALAAGMAMQVAAAAREPLAGVVQTKSTPLNLRAAASIRAQRIGSLPKGSRVTLLGREGDWWEVVDENGQHGFCYAAYIACQTNGAAQSIQLSVPDYKQYDARWANVPIGSFGQTMRQIGCTTTGLAEMESYRTGHRVTPDEMEERSRYTSGGALYWPKEYQVDRSPDYLETLYQNLLEGKPTLFGAKQSNGRSHWVVVVGYRGEPSLGAENFLIQDPGSANRTRLSDLLRDYPIFYKLASY